MSLFGIIQAIFDAFGKYYDTQSTKKKTQSELLINESLRNWPKPNSLVDNISAEYDEDKYQFVESSLKSFEIPHEKYINSHLKTGYKGTWNKWEKVIKLAEKYLLCEAQLKNAILSQVRTIAEDTGYTVYYFKRYDNRPTHFMSAHGIVDIVKSELDRSAIGMPDWWGGSDIKAYPDERFTLTFLHTDAAICKNKRDAETLLSSIKELPAKENIRLRHIALIESKSKYEALHKELELDLEDIMSRARLGSNLKGHCDICSSWLKVS